jgi:hypothetical protein
VTIAVQLEPQTGTLPPVEYRWDTDTDNLSARIGAGQATPGAAGSVELQGTDGSWLVLDLVQGRIGGVEIAVWPDVHKHPGLAPPRAVEDGAVIVAGGANPGQSVLEVEAPIRAEADDDERVIYFRIGSRREARSIRFGRDLLLDVDQGGRIAGLWLLNVPPFPITSPP